MNEKITHKKNEKKNIHFSNFFFLYSANCRVKEREKKKGV